MSPDLAPSAIAPAARHVRARHAALVACTGVAVIGTLLAQERRSDSPARRSAVAKASSQWEDYGGGPDSSKFVVTRTIPAQEHKVTIVESSPRDGDRTTRATALARRIASAPFALSKLKTRCTRLS
jgi:hypothetical protein